MLDPDAPVPASVPLRGILHAYYNPLRGLVMDGEQRTIGNRRYRVTSLDGLEVDIGMSVQLLEDLAALEVGELAPSEMWERLQTRSTDINVDEAVMQRLTVRDSQLRSTVGATLESEPRPSADEVAERRRRRRRSLRRVPPDPELEDLSARATDVGGVIGDDESFVRVGRAWVSEQMQLDPAARATP
jgi:hypothetical protein